MPDSWMYEQMSEAISSIEELVAAREARGLSADDICLQLKLAPRQLLALEAGDWAALPGLAFIRAVLRAYGRLLQLDVSPLVDTLPSTVAPADLRPSVSLDEPMRTGSMLGFSSGGSGSRFAWSLLGVIGVIALALFFGGSSLEGMQSWLAWDDAGPGVRSASTVGMPAPPVAGDSTLEKPSVQAVAGADAARGVLRPEEVRASAVAPIVPSASNPGVGVPASNSGQGGAVGVASPSAEPVGQVGPKPESARSGAPLLERKDAVADPAATGSRSAAPVVSAQLATPVSEAKPAVTETGPATASVPRLRLRFSAESWIEVRAADGAILVTGIQQPGSERDIDTAGSLSLIIGNAHAVNAQLKGEPFDLTVHTRSTVARFTLP